MKYVLSIAAFCLACAPALSADLYIPAEADLMVTSSGYDWSGLYLGAVAGGQGVRMHAPGEGTISGTGLVGGVFVGANGQSGSLVYGAEVDAEYSGYEGSRACGNPAWSCAGYLNWQGSLRGRVGFAVDALLFYATAGVAVGNAGGSTTSPAGVKFNDSHVRAGWTAGGGVEAAFADNWIARVEYRYTDFGKRDMNFDVRYPGVEVSNHAVRAGIAYKF